VQSYSVITEPSSEPITLAEAKLNLRVTNSLEDALITSLIVAARKWVEGFTWRPLMTQTLQANFDKKDVQIVDISLNKFPIQSITSIKYIDANGTEQTINSSTYEVDLISPVCRIRLSEVPTMKDSLNALKIRFVAGYTSSANVPANYKQAMYLIITSLYDNRNQVSTQNAIELPFGVYTLLDIDHNRYNRTISI
jgi:uncharacterized phiE125 gp8 family phage protein